MGYGEEPHPNPSPGGEGLESKSVPGYRARDSPFEEPAPLRRGGQGDVHVTNSPLEGG